MATSPAAIANTFHPVARTMCYCGSSCYVGAPLVKKRGSISTAITKLLSMLGEIRNSTIMKITDAISWNQLTRFSLAPRADPYPTPYSADLGWLYKGDIQSQHDFCHCHNLKPLPASELAMYFAASVSRYV